MLCEPTMLLVNYLELAVVFLLLNSVSTATSLQVTISNNKLKDSQLHSKVGQTVSLNCSISGPNKNAHVLIKWLKNGNLLSSSNTTDGWFVKKITNISLSDGGYYKCEATYNKATNNTPGVFVHLEGRPQIIKCCDHSLSTESPLWVPLRSTRTLKCTATGSPLPDLKWLYNGVELKKTGESIGKFQFVPVPNGLNLFMPEIMKNEEGTYTCQASNVHGKDTYNNRLEVIDPVSDPEIEAVQSNVHATIGQNNTTLTCTGKNIPEIEAEALWFHNGKKLDEDNKNNSRLVFHTTYNDQNVIIMQLTIFDVTKADRGNYTCTVYIDDGMPVNNTISLTVTKKESNNSQPLDPKWPMKVVIPVIVSVLLLVVAVSLLVFYRCRNKVDPPKIPKGPFKYGAFITYSSHDYPWVKANLLTFLHENGIETCIHYRNFEAGELLQQNIVNCIYKSRVVIAVISKHYMKSKYCCSELEYAIHRSIEEPGFNPLIALKIDETIKQKKLPLAIRRKTFLDVTSDVEKDTWKQRLLVHVKGKEDDQNQNVLNGENNPDDEHEALMDPEQVA